jgi:hypothetical protein
MLYPFGAGTLRVLTPFGCGIARFARPSARRARRARCARGNIHIPLRGVIIICGGGPSSVYREESTRPFGPRARNAGTPDPFGAAQTRPFGSSPHSRSWRTCYAHPLRGHEHSSRAFGPREGSSGGGTVQAMRACTVPPAASRPPAPLRGGGARTPFGLTPLFAVAQRGPLHIHHTFTPNATKCSKRGSKYFQNSRVSYTYVFETDFSPIFGHF